MKKDNTAALLVQFEALVRTEQGVEFWFARDLQPLLGYDRWENFAKLLDRAKTSCAGAGQPVADHFRDVTKMVRLGSSSERAVEDVALTRYACYLLARMVIRGRRRSPSRRVTSRCRRGGSNGSSSGCWRSNGCARGESWSRARRSCPP